MGRIKTLAQIGDQCDRIVDYLSNQGRIDTGLKACDVYCGIFERTLETFDIDSIDDETLEWVCEEPLIVGVSY